jgi:magnesium transporter
MRLLTADEAANLIQEADKAERDGLLSLLDDKAHRETVGLLNFAEEQASGKLNPSYARLRPEMSIDEAVSFLRKDAQKRSAKAYYAFVTDSKESLLGVVSFRDLLTASGEKTIGEVMRTDVVTAPEQADRGTLGRLMTQYNLQMIPIVDTGRRIQKIVTREDIGI